MGKDGKGRKSAADDAADDEANTELDATLRRLGDEILKEPVPEHLMRILRRKDQAKPSRRQETKDVPRNAKAEPEKTKD